jgi:hypothetical protein
MHSSMTPGAEADSVLVGVIAPRPSGANVMGHTDRPITYFAASVASDDLALELVVSLPGWLGCSYPISAADSARICLTVRPPFSCSNTISSIMASITSRSMKTPFFSIQALAD